MPGRRRRGDGSVARARSARRCTDLLDVEKLEAGKMKISEEPVDVAAVLRDVLATFRLEAERKGLAFRAVLADRLVVVGDRDRLTQVFTNLVSNAVKYTAHGEVRFTVVLP